LISTIGAVLISAGMLFPVGNTLAAGTYGFSSASNKNCPLWGTLFPLRFRHDRFKGIDYAVNIIWIDDNTVESLAKYKELYHTADGTSTWITSPPVSIPGTQAFCEGATDCVPDGSLNRGVTKYRELVAEFPKEDVHVAKFTPDTNGYSSNVYLPARKVKLFRIEYYSINGSPKLNTTNLVEPIYFEYRATGKGSQLALKEWGSSLSAMSIPWVADVNMPDIFDPSLTSHVLVELTGQGGGVDKPTVVMETYTQQQLDSVPDSCKG
jgi:hypothetical protein